MTSSSFFSRTIDLVILSSIVACPTIARLVVILHNLIICRSSSNRFGFIEAGSVPTANRALSRSAAERFKRRRSISSFIASM
ncbi:hypothetical protein SOVF_089830 [Spinacia oleracea]|nr:hypothetical protein SOVF_089830 [Spinacia oleracea]